MNNFISVCICICLSYHLVGSVCWGGAPDDDDWVAPSKLLFFKCCNVTKVKAASLGMEFQPFVLYGVCLEMNKGLIDFKVELSVPMSLAQLADHYIIYVGVWGLNS